MRRSRKNRRVLQVAALLHAAASRFQIFTGFSEAPFIYGRHHSVSGKDGVCGFFLRCKLVF